MGFEILKRIYDVLYSDNNNIDNTEAFQIYDEILSWIVYYYRVFIGQEHERGSSVAIFDDVNSYKKFKKWFCNRFTTNNCKKIKIPRGKTHVFFTIVEPAEAGTGSHYMGVRVFKDKFTFFDPAISSYSANATWEGEAAKEYMEILADELGLKFEQFIPTKRCQVDQRDIFCQTWSLMWGQETTDKTTRAQATTIFRGKAKKIRNKIRYEDDKLFKFVKKLMAGKKDSFNNWIPKEMAVKNPKIIDYYNLIFNYVSPYDILIGMTNNEFRFDSHTSTEKKKAAKYLDELKRKDKNLKNFEKTVAKIYSHQTTRPSKQIKSKTYKTI